LRCDFGKKQIVSRVCRVHRRKFIRTREIGGFHPIREVILPAVKDIADGIRKMLDLLVDKICRLTGGSFSNFENSQSSMQFKGELAVQLLPAKKRKR